MTVERREALWAEMMPWVTDDAEFVVERQRIEHGRSFSEDALEELYDQFIVFVGTRIMQRWDATHEPPTRLTVEVRVVAS